MEKLKYRLYRFLYGRYGVDLLNQWLIAVACVSFIMAVFIPTFILHVIGYLCWGLYIFRVFSRNIQARYKENEKFKKWIRPILNYQVLLKKRRADKQHRFYRCPNCQQIVRVPKGRGKIIIRCPKCAQEFEKKS